MRVVGVVAALLATFLIVAPANASSATSWRATIHGTTLHGGATTLIQTNGTGTINVKLYGVTPGHSAVIVVNPSACPDEAQDLFSFELPAAGSDGIAAGRHALTAAEVRAYNAALTARTKIALLAVTADDKGCGDQVGSPSVGTARLRGAEENVYRYDIRYPVLAGIDPAAAAAINAAVKDAADAQVAGILREAAAAGPDDIPVALVTETFSVRLSQAGLLSILFSHQDDIAIDADQFPFARTFDTTTGRELGLADVIRTDAASMALINDEVDRALASKGRLYTSSDSVDGDTPWTLVPRGLAFTFNGLGAIGIPPFTAVVPWARIRSILNLQGPVAALAGPGPCQASQLTAKLGAWDAGLGSRFATVTLTNHASTSCFLQGTPQVQLIDSTGRVLLDSGHAGASGLAHASPGDPKVTIAPSGAAETDVRTSNYCGTAPVGAVRVALRLPGGGSARVISTAAPGSSAATVPPCNGASAPHVITTNGWRHA